MKTTSDHRAARLRQWIFLWVVAFLWLLCLLGVPYGMVPVWLFAVASVAAFIAAWRLNLRLVTMSRRIEDGLCWKCGDRLEGIESKQCPECGAEVGGTPKGH